MIRAGVNPPAMLVLLASIVIGLIMVLVFGYASDQKAIHQTKDRLKAHLLALRLFQDQIPVVIRCYGRILLAISRYLRLALWPLLLTALPLALVIAQLDRYLGSAPLKAGQTFLVKARVSDPQMLSETSLQLPNGLKTSAPAVHILAENTVVWRVAAETDGDYNVKVQTSSQVFSKRVVVAPGLPRLSPVRLRGPFWERIFVSGEPALPKNSAVQSIEVEYPSRSIAFADFTWNWVWLLFVLSLVAGFAFKSILGIEI
jgi:hypothetical protein